MNAILAGILPRFIQSHLLFYVFKCINPWLFSTYSTLDSSMQSYWTQSMVSTIVCTYMWAHIMAEMVVLDFSDILNYTTSPVLLNVFYTFIGYLVSDFLLYVYYRTTWSSANSIIVHHIITMTILSLLLKYTMITHTQIAQCLLCEITNPFVNQLYFFKTSGMHSSPLFRINGIIIVVVWFIFRVVNYTVLCMRILQHYDHILASHLAKFAFLLFAILYYMQLAWFYKIVRGCLKELKQN